eukprot:TRINITY_DN7563_c0_g1_i1.p1 TRINITY_DN7563_c0_g1~~TRINITY_DN7563_c0_g1_i1.p1  ORF type:complete len:317 (+),score=49.89 TRINITY_DN7563_c0_g1_i1:181-1131(+)
MTEDVALSYNNSYWTMVDSFTGGYQEQSTILGVSLSTGEVKQLTQENDRSLQCLLQNSPYFYTVTTDANIHFKISSIDPSSGDVSLLMDIDTVALYGVQLYGETGECAMVYSNGDAMITWLAFGYGNESLISESVWLFSYDLSSSSLTASMLNLVMNNGEEEVGTNYPVNRWTVSGLAVNSSSPDGDIYTVVSVNPFVPDVPPIAATYCSLAVISTGDLKSEGSGSGVASLDVKTYGDNLCVSGAYLRALKLLPTPETSDRLYTYLYPIGELVPYQSPASIVALEVSTGTVIYQYPVPENATGIKDSQWRGGFVGL